MGSPGVTFALALTRIAFGEMLSGRRGVAVGMAAAVILSVAAAGAQARSGAAAALDRSLWGIDHECEQRQNCGTRLPRTTVARSKQRVTERSTGKCERKPRVS